MTTHVRQYESVTALLEATEGHSDMALSSRASIDRGMDSWAGNCNMKQAQELALRGWSEHLPMVKRLTDSLEHHFDNALVNTFDPIADVSGQVVDMGKYLSGEPECMIDFRPVTLTKVGRVVSIHVNNTYSGSTNADAVVKRGAAICALIDCIEKTGNVVEVFAESVISGRSSGGDILSYSVRVKASTDAMDMGKLLFAIAHPAMLRRMVFAVMERENSAIRSAFNIGSGYGIPAECVQANADAILVKPPKHGDILNSDPEEWIRLNLTNLGLI